MSFEPVILSPQVIAALYPKSMVLCAETGSTKATPALMEPAETTPIPVTDAGAAPAITISKTIPPPEAPPALRFLGDNKQQITIIVRYEEAVFVPDTQLPILTKILTACRLSLADVAIINWHYSKNNNYRDMLSSTSPRKVILLGTPPAALEMPLHFPDFQLQPFSGVTYLSAPSLEVMEQDKLLKSKLWVSLQQLLGLAKT